MDLRERPTIFLMELLEMVSMTIEKLNEGIRNHLRIYNLYSPRICAVLILLILPSLEWQPNISPDSLLDTEFEAYTMWPKDLAGPEEMFLFLPAPKSKVVSFSNFFPSNTKHTLLRLECEVKLEAKVRYVPQCFGVPSVWRWYHSEVISIAFNFMGRREMRRSSEPCPREACTICYYLWLTPTVSRIDWLFL